MNDKSIILKRPREFLPKQVDVFKLVFKKRLGRNGKPMNNYVLYSGAFGAGKTILLAHVGIAAALNYPNSVGLVGSQTYPQIRDVVFRTFIQELERYQQILDENNIPIKLFTETISIGKMNINFYNGSEIWFRSCDKERNLAGRSIDWFGLDEPVDMKEGVMKQLIGRLRGTAIPFHFAILATNPEAKSHWLYQYFYKEKRDGYFAIDTNTYDNYLLENFDEYIRGLSGYDEDWKRRYLNGEWGAFSGQIYKGFNPEKHVEEIDVDNYIKNRKDLIDYFIAGVDWGMNDPTCILLILVTKDGQLKVFEEYYVHEETSNKIAHVLADYNKKYKFQKVYIDPSANNLRKEADLLGVPCADKNDKSYADNNVLDGIARVSNVINKNIITIDTSCVNLVRSLLAYHYKEETNMPVKKDDHAADALRYALSDVVLDEESPMFACGRWIKKRMS